MDLDKESIAKLNAEINYYLNQQYTVLVASVTLVGAVLAWLTKSTGQLDEMSIKIAFLGTIALLMFLSLMAIVEARLTVAIAICGTYLRLSKVMKWERDIEQYRSVSPINAVLTSRGAFYIVLSSVVIGWPFLLSHLALGRITFDTYTLAVGAFGVLYLIMVFVLLPYFITLRLNQIENTWRRVLASDQ